MEFKVLELKEEDLRAAVDEAATHVVRALQAEGAAAEALAAWLEGMVGRAMSPQDLAAGDSLVQLYLKCGVVVSETMTTHMETMKLARLARTLRARAGGSDADAG